MYAIVKIGGRQYRVNEERYIDVNKLPYVEGDEIVFNEVLLLANGTGTTIGTPIVEGATVTATVEQQFRGEKLIVYKYRQRTSYRRKQGHRQYHTRLRIKHICCGGNCDDERHIATRQVKTSGMAKGQNTMQIPEKNDASTLLNNHIEHLPDEDAVLTFRALLGNLMNYLTEHDPRTELAHYSRLDDERTADYYLDIARQIAGEIAEIRLSGTDKSLDAFSIIETVHHLVSRGNSRKAMAYLNQFMVKARAKHKTFLVSDAKG